MIKLSKKWDYAIKALVFIAESKENFFTVADIAKRNSISESLLRRIIADLEKSHIISTHKWRWWWVSLAKEIYQISLFDILSAIWEELWLTDCTRGDECDKQDSCSTTSVFHSLQHGFNTLLKIYTLDKIIKK
jgi:Rrf2 family protein